ncbi:MAG: SCP2 sterol-binding domain-containing protein, partial [Promethearchaeota archaeon]
MVDVSRILEIKKNGAETATSEDIQLFYNIIAEYLNTDPDVKEKIKDLSLSISIDIDGKRSSLIVDNGKAEFKSEKVSDPDVQLFSDLKTMASIAAGLLDAQKAFLSGKLEVDGDFEKMIIFLEILEDAYEKLGIATKEERDILVDAA